MQTDRNQIKQAVALVMAVAETIRESGSVPSCHLWAGLMARMDFEAYQKMIQQLKNAGLIEETPAHLLRWIGPEVTR